MTDSNTKRLRHNINQSTKATTTTTRIVESVDFPRQDSPQKVMMLRGNHISHDQQYTDHRWLGTSSSSSSPDSVSGGLTTRTGATAPGIAIAWYSIVLTFFVGLVLCCCWSQGRQRRARREAESEDEPRDVTPTNDDDDNPEDLALIARIQANIKVFSEKQQGLKKKQLLKTMKDQFVTVTTADLDDETTEDETEPEQQVEKERKSNKQRNKNNNKPKFHFAAGCSICMEPFATGDVVAHSCRTTTNHQNQPSKQDEQEASSESQAAEQSTAEQQQCRHLFHQQCIVPWFVAQDAAQQKCPVCWQVFCQNHDNPRNPNNSAGARPADNSEENNNNNNTDEENQRSPRLTPRIPRGEDDVIHKTDEEDDDDDNISA